MVFWVTGLENDIVLRFLMNSGMLFENSGMKLIDTRRCLAEGSKQISLSLSAIDDTALMIAAAIHRSSVSEREGNWLAAYLSEAKTTCDLSNTKWWDYS